MIITKILYDTPDMLWCASYIDMMGDMNALHYKACPTCNHTAIELLPLSDGEYYSFEYTATRGVVLEFR